MSEHEQTDAGTARGGRAAMLMRLGGLAFAVYADECECVAPLAEPAPLPHAPAPVLGVVSVRGRMRTVLHPARLFETLGLDFDRQAEECAFAASLAGDEQLALVFDTSGLVPSTPGSLDAPPDAPALPVRGTFRRDGETVYLLDPARLFDAAMSGTERRRQRAVSREP
ncbi:MAG TPA: chemotaxis protein CheW [Pyrinomonadaceae bacterium]|jgi:chemotaxis signal transduction protein